MKTNFIEYYNKREHVNFLLESVVLEAQNNPEFLKVLEEAGFWSNLVDAGKKFVQGAWNQGGIQSGAKAAWSQMTGPKTQLANAMASLNKALAGLQQDPQWKDSMTTGDPAKGYKSIPLVNWLQDTIKELDNQQKQFANKELPSTAAAAPVSVPSQPDPGATTDPTGRKGT
jgi:hypothetical protein